MWLALPTNFPTREAREGAAIDKVRIGREECARLGRSKLPMAERVDFEATSLNFVSCCARGRAHSGLMCVCVTTLSLVWFGLNLWPVSSAKASQLPSLQ